MAIKSETYRLHEDIKIAFDKLSSVKEYGVQKNSTEWIMNHLANKFYKSPKTIENIVFGRTYVQKIDVNQTALF